MKNAEKPFKLNKEAVDRISEEVREFLKENKKEL